MTRSLCAGASWAKTLLLITYDENGGYHDHVHAPQGAVNPMFIDPLTNQPVTYRGFRVPAFVASPFVPAWAVSHEVYDHTSILKTIMNRFLAQSPPNMGPRVAAAHDVGSMLE
jgi:phospholipase C